MMGQGRAARYEMKIIISKKQHQNSCNNEKKLTNWHFETIALIQFWIIYNHPN